jgi:hypothetical protein
MGAYAAGVLRISGDGVGPPVMRWLAALARAAALMPALGGRKAGDPGATPATAFAQAAPAAACSVVGTARAVGLAWWLGAACICGSKAAGKPTTWIVTTKESNHRCTQIS